MPSCGSGDSLFDLKIVTVRIVEREDTVKHLPNKVLDELTMKGMVDTFSQAKSYAMQLILIGTLFIGISFSYFGRPEQGTAIVVAVFVSEGLIFALKRELGIFGILLGTD